MPKTILIVEDTELDMRLFKDLLEANGYDTAQSVDGADIIRLAKEHKPDLIIMDIQLPKVSGLELTKLLRADKETVEIPIIAVTAFAMIGDEQRILSAGCDGYITKPFSVPMLLEAIEKLIKQTEPQPAVKTVENERHSSKAH